MNISMKDFSGVSSVSWLTANRAILLLWKDAKVNFEFTRRAFGVFASSRFFIGMKWGLGQSPKHAYNQSISFVGNIFNRCSYIELMLTERKTTIKTTEFKKNH